jgi:hypothetical protein
MLVAGENDRFPGNGTLSDSHAKPITRYQVSADEGTPNTTTQPECTPAVPPPPRPM